MGRCSMIFPSEKLLGETIIFLKVLLVLVFRVMRSVEMYLTQKTGVNVTGKNIR